MCLYLVAEIFPDAPAKVSARRLSEVSGLRIKKLKSAEKEVLHFSTDGSCSCGFLAEDFKIAAPVWKLNDVYVPALVTAIELLSNVTKHFMLTCNWLGEDFEETEVNVKLEELVQEIMSNGIRNSVSYFVKP